MNYTQKMTTLAGAIAATAFLGMTAILPQAAFAGQNPGASGDPRVDEPNTNTRVDDPSRPATNVERPANAAPAQEGIYSNPSGQMNNTGVGGGAGGSEAGRADSNQVRPQDPQNRIERYSQPGATDPSRSTEFTPPTNSPNRTNSSGQMNNTGVGGGAGGSDAGQSNMNQARPEDPKNRIERYSQPGATDPSRSTESTPPANSPNRNDSSGQMNQPMNNTGAGSGAGGVSGDRGNDRFTAPNTNTPGRGTYTTPRSQVNDAGVGGTNGSVDDRINNSTSPGSATPGSGSTNYNNNATPNNSGAGVDNSGSTGGGAGGSGAVPGLW